MMTKFPVVSGKQFLKFLQNQGFQKIRQKGSHIVMRKDGIARPLVVPNDKEVSIGVVKNNLKTAGIAEADFTAAMRKPKKGASSG